MMKKVRKKKIPSTPTDKSLKLYLEPSEFNIQIVCKWLFFWETIRTCDTFVRCTDKFVVKFNIDNLSDVEIDDDEHGHGKLEDEIIKRA